MVYDTLEADFLIKQCGDNQMDSRIIENLRSFAFFSGFGDEFFLDLAAKVDQMSLVKDQVLFMKGDEGHNLYILLEGRIKLVSENRNGEEIVLNEVGPGGVIGEMALLDDKPRSAGATALSKVKMLKLSKEDFEDMITRYPLMVLKLTRNLISRLRFATTYIENAIEWSQRIADGDYSLIEEREKLAIPPRGELTYEDLRAKQFLATFFHMIEDIKAREDNLKKQLIQLKIEIDQTKRQEDVEKIISTEVFKKLSDVKRKKN